MSFHKSLIEKIKSNKRLDVYNLLDQLLNNHLNLDVEDSFIIKEIKQHHMDLILSFISTEENPSIICNYLNMIIEFYQKRNWTLNLSSYSLIIRILCSLNRFDEALKYLEMSSNIINNVKNRMINPFFEFYKNLNVLITLFEKYHDVMSEKEYYYLFLNFKTHKLSSSFLFDEEKVKDIIEQIFQIWANNDFIMNEKLLDLVLFWTKTKTINKSKNKTKIISCSSDIIIKDGFFCNNCKNKMVKHILEKGEKEKLSKELILAHPQSEQNLENFINWFNKNLSMNENENNKNIVLNILDGGNIGHFIKGEFSLEAIKQVLNKLSKSVNDNEYTINLLILHQRHFKKYKTEINQLNLNLNSNSNLKLINYATPYQENDDLYWMLASFMSNFRKTFVITNDLLRDHHVNKLDETLFKRWKENNLVSYYYSSDNVIELNYPLEYTIGVQFNENGLGYHIPVMNETSDNIDWYCLKKIKKVLD